MLLTREVLNSVPVIMWAMPLSEAARQRKNERERERKAALKQAGVKVHTEDKLKQQARALGLTPEEYEELRTSPCDICGKADAPNTPYAPQGAVTGVVCKPCALALGHFKHNPERLRRALTLFN